MPKKQKTSPMLMCAICAVTDSGALPEWVMICPPGQTMEGRQGEYVLGRDGRVFHIADAADVVTASIEHEAVYGAPLDEQHKTQLDGRWGGSAPAYGWFKDYRTAANGAIEAKVEWTDLGEAAVTRKHYRFISLAADVYERDGVYEVVAITGGGLTNWQNLEVQALNHQQNNKEDGMLKALLMALCGKEDATQEEALNAIQTLQTARTTLNSQGSVVPKADYDRVSTALNAAQAELKTNKETAFKEKVTAAINAAVEAGKVSPASKPFWEKTIATEDALNSFETDFVAKAPVLTPDQSAPTGTPPGGSGTALNQSTLEMGRIFGNSKEDLEKYGK